jgi:hypothetical protein
MQAKFCHFGHETARRLRHDCRDDRGAVVSCGGLSGPFLMRVRVRGTEFLSGLKMKKCGGGIKITPSPLRAHTLHGLMQVGGYGGSIF